MRRKLGPSPRHSRPGSHPALAAARFFAPPLKLLRNIRHGEVWEFDGEIVMVREDDSNPRRAKDVLLYLADVLTLLDKNLDAYSLRTLAGKLDAHEVEETLLKRCERILEQAQGVMAKKTIKEIYEVLSSVEQPPIWGQ